MSVESPQNTTPVPISRHIVYAIFYHAIVGPALTLFYYLVGNNHDYALLHGGITSLIIATLLVFNPSVTIIFAICAAKVFEAVWLVRLSVTYWGYVTWIQGSHIPEALVAALIVAVHDLFWLVIFFKRRSLDAANIAARRHLFLAVSSIVGSAAITMPCILLSVSVFANYGSALFAATPLVQGYIASVLRCRAPGATRSACISCALSGIAVVALSLFIFAFEGGICIVMAAPLAIPLSVVGAVMGHSAAGKKNLSTATLCSVILINPILISAEGVLHRVPPQEEVVTTIHSSVPPGRLWSVLTSSVEVSLGLAHDTLGRIGISGPNTLQFVEGPERTELRCQVGEGYYSLPVIRNVSGRVLEFTLIETPPPMKELSPYEELEAPHLKGYFTVQKGSIELVPAPDGGTTIIATTTYVHALWPIRYWRIWSNFLIDSMHERVIRAVERHAVGE